eukprot:gene6919-7649_t
MSSWLSDVSMVMIFILTIFMFPSNIYCIEQTPHPTTPPPPTNHSSITATTKTPTTTVFHHHDLSSFFKQPLSSQYEEIDHFLGDREVFAKNVLFPTEESRQCLSNETYFHHPYLCPFSASGQGRSKRIFYNKPHKTGSSSAACILWTELCQNQGMNCFLPHWNDSGRMWSMYEDSHREYILNSIGTGYRTAPFDAWLAHNRLSKRLYHLLKKPFLHVSSTRHPGLRFYSAWYFYGIQPRKNITYHDFISTLQSQSIPYEPLHHLRSSFHPPWYVREWGLEAISQEQTGVSLFHANFKHIFFHNLAEKVTSYKIFLIVTERFDESMLILRWLLEWPKDDLSWKHARRFRNQSVVTGWDQFAKFKFNGDNDSEEDGVGRFRDENMWYIAQKVRNTTFGNNSTLWPPHISLLQSFQPYDSFIHLLANRVLDRLIHFYGEEQFKQELERYRHNLREVQAYCSMEFAMSAFKPSCKRDNLVGFGGDNGTIPYCIRSLVQARKLLSPQHFTCWLLRQDVIDHVNHFWLLRGASEVAVSGANFEA